MIFISHSYVTPLTLSSIHSLTFFSPTGCLLHHKNFSLPPHFLTTMTSFFHTLTDFFSSQVCSSIIKNITNTYTHNYYLAFLFSSIKTPILPRIGHLIFSLTNSNTNPGQDWSHAFQSPQFQIPILARIGHMIL